MKKILVIKIYGKDYSDFRLFYGETKSCNRCILPQSVINQPQKPSKLYLSEDL